MVEFGGAVSTLCCLLFLAAACLISAQSTPSDGTQQEQQRRLQPEPNYWVPKGFRYYERTGKLSLHPLATSPFTKTKCHSNNDTQQAQIHIPAFLIAGAPKSGTSLLEALLHHHPKVIRPRIKELRYFHEMPLDWDGGVNVSQVRQFLSDQRDGFPIQALQNDVSKITYDATPNYLCRSSLLMAPILCACPWIKIIVILRDPVERAFSEYRYRLQREASTGTFEQLIAEEMHVLQLSGLLDAAHGSQEETEAWNRYHALAITGTIGKGLYEIQLRHTVDALHLFDMDPKQHLLVLRTERDLLQLPETYRAMLEFLGLPEAPMPPIHHANEGTVHLEMEESDRILLNTFYEPYQRRFADWVRDYPNGNANITSTS
jgi:hypothetical protein